MQTGRLDMGVGKRVRFLGAVTLALLMAVPALGLPDYILPAPAKRSFGLEQKPAALKPNVFGFYSKGCLAGAVQLPDNGPSWQAMRLSRNRHWGHPQTIEFIKNFSAQTRDVTGWNGLLIGDIAQPRGGPMLTGHVSHQTGLDADIWFTPAPKKTYSTKERENISAISMLTKNRRAVNTKRFTNNHIKMLKLAADNPKVERILVNPVIKAHMCKVIKRDRNWLKKVRPVRGHHYHFHVRMACPEDSKGCKKQPPPTTVGCGASLSDFIAKLFAPRTKPRARPKSSRAPRQRAGITMADLPKQCRAVRDVN